MASPAISLAGVSKRYRKYDDNPMLLTAAFRLRRGTRTSDIWAVRNVDLDVADGECVGVIGRNGAGKSTLLQLLAGVTAPSEGRVRVRGRIAPLISVGVGFHPELTGLENVYLNGMILGMSRAEIDQKLDEILDFAEIPGFAETPVKFYSSGMSVRLGFAVAIQARPDVLLLDEVLAVGDIAFQMKCFDRMTEILASDATVMVVSHNLNSIRRLCDRVMVIDQGSPTFLGDPEEGIHVYQDALGRADSVAADSDGPAILADVARIPDVGLAPLPHDATTLEITVSVEVMTAHPSSSLAILLTTATGLPVYYETSPERGALVPGRHQWRMRMRAPAAGAYRANLAIRSLEPMGRIAVARPVEFTVDGPAAVSGLADLRGDLVRAPRVQE